MLGEEDDGGGDAELTGEGATGQQSLAHDVGRANQANGPRKKRERQKKALAEQRKRRKEIMDAMTVMDRDIVNGL